MLTEYSTRDDIRKFRDKVFLKYEEMKDGWLGKEINRWMLLNRKKVGHYMVRSFKVDNQEVTLEIYPSVIQSTNRASKKLYSFALGTPVETRNGIHSQKQTMKYTCTHRTISKGIRKGLCVTT